ncbi:MAG: hypothetical protein KGY70_12680, partial [Bacteroidales bacterium]|nr:hypothetical protein [Bacteroidales bacterium]
ELSRDMPWRVSSWPVVYTTARRHERTTARKNDWHGGTKVGVKTRRGEKEKREKRRIGEYEN